MFSLVICRFAGPVCKSIEAFSPYLSIQVSALLRKKRGLVGSVWSVLGAGKGSLSSIVQYLCRYHMRPGVLVTSRQLEHGHD